MCRYVSILSAEEMRTLKEKRGITCEHCNGTGIENGNVRGVELCPFCGGLGKIIALVRVSNGKAENEPN